MPKIVDHDVRREDIIAATWRVIARDGLAGTTTRKIARESGFTSSLLAHYFSDKEEILDFALALAYERAISRVQSCIKERVGLDALRETLLQGLPLDKERRLGIEVLICFWGRQLGERDRSGGRYSSYQKWRKQIKNLMGDAIELGEIRHDLDLDVATDMLVALVDGIAAEAVLYPTHFPRNRQINAIDAALTLLGSSALG